MSLHLFHAATDAVLVRAWSRAEADLIVDLLEVYGIHAWTQLAADDGADAGTLGLLRELDILVGEADVEEAAALLVEHAEVFGDEAGDA